MRKRQAERLTLLAISLTFFALGLGAKILNRSFQMALMDKATLNLWAMSALVIALMIMAILIEHHIFKGVRYFWYHWIILNCLERQMIDAGIMVRHGNIIVTPKIQLSFSKDLNSATLRIRNALKYNKVLDDVVMSSALRKFVVERHYSTDDGNWYIYELVDGSVSFKQTYNSLDEFLQYSKTISTYKLFLDSRSTPRLQHAILVGQTGSGKTYAVYSLLMQMLYKDVPYHLYFADPKGSSLAVIGQEIAPERTASSVEAIIESLGQFVALMRERKTELRKRLKTRIDADYSDFGMSPYIFICDEYASFASVLASSDKKTRDKVKALLYEVILQGRQLGFFLFIIMQKSDATLIDTALRDNIPLKIVLGNSEQQTYVTAFGAGVDIPNRHYSVGEGVFTEPVLAPEPKLVQFPYCNFDILQACKQASVV
ncbi:MAG: hypothetical protein KBS74_05080 [Clostridiales bacterium]|nr:hypothetical protein [Candidatus Cacconaster stercorequi]